MASTSFLHIVTSNNHDIPSATLTNLGTVIWTGGPLRGGGAPHVGNPPTLIYNFGLWDAQNDLTFDNAFGTAGNYVFINSGTFRKSGGTGATTLTSGTSFGNSGTLDIRTGTVNPAGTYALTNGTLSFRINNLTDFGKLSLASSATLGGPLNVTLNGGFVPAVGNRFQLVSCSGVSGTFSSVNVPSRTSVIYANNGVFLVVPVQILSPELSGTNLTFNFLTANGQNYTLQYNDDLSTTNWVIYTNFIGDGLPALVRASVSAGPERFFRVLAP